MADQGQELGHAEHEALDSLVGAGYRLIASIDDLRRGWSERLGGPLPMPGLSDFYLALNRAEAVLHPIEEDPDAE